MTDATVAPRLADTLPPDELDKASEAERLAAYSEDWISAPRRADCGRRLGPETHAHVQLLFERGYDEARLRDAALDALAAQEARIVRRHRWRGWLVFLIAVAIGAAAAVANPGRGEDHGLLALAILGGIGLMLAHGVHMHGLRERSRLIRRSAVRRAIWQRAMARLAGHDG